MTTSTREETFLSFVQSRNIILSKETHFIVILGKSKSGPSVPDSLEGRTDKDEILDTFKTVYMDLYNSADTSNATNIIKAKIADMIDNDSMNEVKKITGETVKLACKNMKKGKNYVSQ